MDILILLPKPKQTFYTKNWAKPLQISLALSAFFIYSLMTPVLSR